MNESQTVNNIIHNYVEVNEHEDYTDYKGLINALIEWKNEELILTDVVRKKEQLNVYFNVGDNVVFDNKKAVILWTSIKYVDIEIIGTNKIYQGVRTSLISPR
jgi:hypothetical protein